MKAVYRFRLALATLFGLLLSSSLPAQKGELAPTNVAIAAVGSSANVTWTPVLARGVNYRVLRASDAQERGADLTDPITAASFEDPKVDAGATYFYQVVAVYPDGSVFAAAPVAFTVPIAIVVAAPIAPIAMPQVSRQPVTFTAIPPGSPAVAGNPANAIVSWGPASGASAYSVERWSQVNPSCCRTASPLLPANTTSWSDANYPLDGAYTFRVTAHYADGAQAAADVSWVRPVPQDPAGFKAVHVAGNSVQLTWQAVPGVSRYLVSGPGTNNSVPVLGSALSVAVMSSGPQTWMISSLYEPGGVFTKGVQTSTVVRLLPAHAPAWLSKHDAGAAADLFWASDQVYVCGGSYSGVGYSGSGNWNGCNARLEQVDRKFQGLVSSESAFLPQDAVAVYANVNDFGAGRTTRCITKGMSAMCVSSSHRLTPQSPPAMPPAPEYASTFNEPLPWNAALGYTAIIADPLGMRFLSFSGASAGGYCCYWLTRSDLDSEGPKSAPQACLACHGGRWNPIMKVVTGATMLPIDPSNLEFAPGARAQNEEAIRKLNMVVLNRAPSPAVAAYIKGLYNGAPQQPGMVANDNYVPPGWVQQPGFYRAVIKPYCANCHMAASTTVDLSSFGSVQRNKALIYSSVCVQRSMPHAEAPFRQFWTRDTGAVYLPGYFAAMLGYASCP